MTSVLSALRVCGRSMVTTATGPCVSYLTGSMPHGNIPTGMSSRHELTSRRDFPQTLDGNYGKRLDISTYAAV